MTALNKAFLNTPQYQRKFQRLSTMAPKHQRAIDTVLLDDRFASKEMRDSLDAMRRGMKRTAAERSFRSRARDFRTRKGFDEDRLNLLDKKYEYDKKQNKYAQYAALANMGLGAVAGQMGRDKAPVETTDDADWINSIRKFRDPKMTQQRR